MSDCLDWSERRHHLAGAVRAALFSSTLGQGRFERLPGTRALLLTATGRTALNELLGLTF